MARKKWEGGRWGKGGVGKYKAAAAWAREPQVSKKRQWGTHTPNRRQEHNNACRTHQHLISTTNTMVTKHRSVGRHGSSLIINTLKYRITTNNKQGMVVGMGRMEARRCECSFIGGEQKCKTNVRMKGRGSRVVKQTKPCPFPKCLLCRMPGEAMPQIGRSLQHRDAAKGGTLNANADDEKKPPELRAECCLHTQHTHSRGHSSPQMREIGHHCHTHSRKEQEGMYEKTPHNK